MIPVVKSVTRDNFPFRRLLRSEKPMHSVFTRLAVETNENELVALQYMNSLLSMEDISILADAQEGNLPSLTQSKADQVYHSLSYSNNQISFAFLTDTALSASTPAVTGRLLNQET